MNEKQVIVKIEVRIGELKAYQTGLNYDPTDGKIPPERRVAIDADRDKTQARIDELERLKRVIYTS